MRAEDCGIWLFLSIYGRERGILRAYRAAKCTAEMSDFGLKTGSFAHPPTAADLPRGFTLTIGRLSDIKRNRNSVPLSFFEYRVTEAESGLFERKGR